MVGEGMVTVAGLSPMTQKNGLPRALRIQERVVNTQIEGGRREGERAAHEFGYAAKFCCSVMAGCGHILGHILYLTMNSMRICGRVPSHI